MSRESYTGRPHGAGAELPGLPGWSRFILALLALGSAALSPMSFAGTFDAVRGAVEKWFGGYAWMIPVGTDLGIVQTSAFSVFFEAIGMPLWRLRPVTLASSASRSGSTSAPRTATSSAPPGTRSPR